LAHPVNFSIYNIVKILLYTHATHHMSETLNWPLSSVVSSSLQFCRWS